MRAGAAAALAAGITLAASACGASHSSSHYGGYPKFLPPSTLHTDPHHVVVATDAQPDYASQGDTVDVHLASGDALITAVGPATPGQGLDPEPQISYVTWTVTVVGEKGSVPVALRDFSAVDDVGRLYPMSPTQGEAPIPSKVTKGTKVTFAMRAQMPTGEGLLHWEPGGKLSPVAWDFTVETD